MNHEYKYKNPGERTAQIKIAEAEGLVMLHDNFDNPAWKPGEPQIGTMIFTDTPPVNITPPPRNLAAEFDALKKTLKTKGVITENDLIAEG
jgi:hypothetical protein